VVKQNGNVRVIQARAMRGDVYYRAVVCLERTPGVGDLPGLAVSSLKGSLLFGKIVSFHLKRCSRLGEKQNLRGSKGASACPVRLRAA